MGVGESKCEVEIKLRAADVAEARRRLRRAGFRVRRRRVFESNVGYDTPAGALGREGKLLRIRRAGRQVLLTYKGPAEPGRHKRREELEMGLSDGARGGELLERLGFQPFFYYEKYRTEFTRGGSAGTAMLDQTPIGIYIELEGPPGWIDAAARDLGYEASDYITETYAQLFAACGGLAGRRARRMAFGERP